MKFAEDAKATKAAPILKAKLDELAGWASAQQKRLAAKEQQSNAYAPPLLEWIAKTVKGAKVKADGRAAVAAADMNVTHGVTALSHGAAGCRLHPYAAMASLSLKTI